MKHTTTTLIAIASACLPTLALAVCGNGVLDGLERCDDANTADGDGCSSLCQVEAGYACTDPVTAGDINGLADGGFELMAAGSPWNTSVVSPLCRAGTCGIGTGSGAASGDGWAWFGGRALPVSQFAEQSVYIPSAAGQLRFSLETPLCDSAADRLRLSIDGIDVWSVDGADAYCGTPGYREIDVDLALATGGPYNDDAMHTLRFEAVTMTANGGISNFFVDDVVLAVGTYTDAPGSCTQRREVCGLEAFEGLAGSFATAGWSVFNSGVVGADWGTSDDGICNSVNGPPGNHTGGTGDAACIDADAIASASGNAQIDAYLCSPALDFSTLSDTALRFRLNYQIVSDPGPDDIFEVRVAESAVAPSPTSIAAYPSVYARGGVNAGEIGLISGEHVTIDLTPLDGSPSVYVCFRYGARDDWYAQVDDAAITAQTCAAGDLDGDGVTDNIDNCTEVGNPAQGDSDGDGFGNACDPDIAGPGGSDDCRVNFLDLQTVKDAFFSTPAAPAWNPNADFSGPGGEPDGIVNFIDVVVLAARMFGAPGPSALATCP